MSVSIKHVSAYLCPKKNMMYCSKDVLRDLPASHSFLTLGSFQQHAIVLIWVSLLNSLFGLVCVKQHAENLFLSCWLVLIPLRSHLSVYKANFVASHDFFRSSHNREVSLLRSKVAQLQTDYDVLKRQLTTERFER